MQLSSVLVIISSQIVLVAARTGFAKNENEDLVEFPPVILQTFDSSIPVGHLRPLGQSACIMIVLCVIFVLFNPHDRSLS